MVIIILLICGTAFSFLIYCMYSTFKYSNWDIVGCIENDKKGFFWSTIGIIISLVVAYYCFVTPTYFISNQYIHKNGTMTSVEYSLTGDSVVKNSIKSPKDTYGIVTKVTKGSRLMGKICYHYINVTIKLNDGREMTKEFDDNERNNIKEGNAMSITETYYPSYKIDYNF